MEIFSRYVYFIGALVAISIWSILFWARKDLRRPMLAMSFLGVVLGVTFEYFFWTVDWWHPLTITKTRIGIEDVLFGASNGGIAAVIYEEIFKKRLYKYEAKPHTLSALLVIAAVFAVTFYLVYILKFSSFVAGTTAVCFAILYLLISRRDLILDAFLTGLCLLVTSAAFFLTISKIYPDFVNQTWNWQHMSGIKLFGAPFEDLVFFFLSGVLIAPFYLFWKGDRLRSLPIRKENTRRRKR